MIIPTPTNINDDGEKKAKHQHISRYVTDLRSIIGFYIGWIPENPREVDDFYEILKNDAAIAHALNLLSLMAVGEYFEVSGHDEKFNRIVVKALLQIERFTHVRKSICEKAALFGLAVMRKRWKEVSWPEYPGLRWVVPYRLHEVDKRRMRMERDIENKDRIWWSIWSPREDAYVLIEDRATEPNAALALQDFLFYFYEREEMSPYFRGLGETLYTLAYMKHRLIQAWAELSEKWSQPFLTATINAAKAAYNAATNSGGGVQDASSVMANWLNLLENMRARHVAVIPDHDSLNVQEAGGTGNNIIAQLVDYIDNKIQLLILGAELTTTTASGAGSYALGQVHKGATNSILMYHRAGIEELFERDLIFDFYMRNRKNFRAIGVKWPGIGGFRFSLKVAQEEQHAKMMENMRGAGGGGQRKLQEAGMM